MHYADFILATQGPLSLIWLAAHWDKKLNKNTVITADIVQSIQKILSPNLNVALKTTGHLLLGVVKIYAKKTTYLLHDCNDAISFFSYHSKSSKPYIQTVSGNTSKYKKNSMNKLGNVSNKSNLSRIEDITIQPPDDFLNQTNFFEQFKDDLYIEYDSHNIIEHETHMIDDNLLGSIGNITQPNHNNISYELARDQSISNQNDHTTLFDTTHQSALTYNGSYEGDQPIFSNINIEDIDQDTFPDNLDQNQLLNSALNNFTIGSSVNLSRRSAMFNHQGDPNRLDEIILDPINGFQNSSVHKQKSYKSKISRKRSLIVDTSNVIVDEDFSQPRRFKDIVHTQGLIGITSNIFPQKENIPPNDDFVDQNSLFMTLRNLGPISKPLAKRCENLLCDNNFLLNSNTRFHTYESDFMNNLDYNDDFQTDVQDNHSIHIDTTTVDDNYAIDDNININQDSHNSSSHDLNKTLDQSLEKYDRGDINWSRSTADMAKSLLTMYRSSNKTVTFEVYLKSANISTRKMVAQNFYSLLLLQRENLFLVKQNGPYNDISIIPSNRLLSSDLCQLDDDGNKPSMHSR